MDTYTNNEMDLVSFVPTIITNTNEIGLSFIVETPIHELHHFIHNFLDKQPNLVSIWDENACICVNGYDDVTGLLIERFQIQVFSYKSLRNTYYVEFTTYIRNGAVNDHYSRTFREMRNIARQQLRVIE